MLCRSYAIIMCLCVCRDGDYTAFILSTITKMIDLFDVATRGASRCPYDIIALLGNG